VKVLNNEIGRLTQDCKRLNEDINLGYDLVQNLDVWDADRLE